MDDPKLTPEQALANLSLVAEQYHCNGATRDALRASSVLLAEKLAELAAIRPSE